jgi:hypothetical protein
MNKNNLTFFYSLSKHDESLKCDSFTLEQFYAAVERAFQEYNPDILERMHAFQYKIYLQIIRNSGDNQFYQPPSDIRKRQRDEAGIFDYTVPVNLYNYLISTLDNWVD